MLRLKLAIESLQNHIDYDKKANGMQTGLITIGIAEAETLLELLKEQEVKEQISDAIHETAKQFRQTIVRCKDCIHFEPNNIPEEGCGTCVLMDRIFYNDNFCGYGEKVKKNE